jgi:hypothetical protein
VRHSQAGPRQEPRCEVRHPKTGRSGAVAGKPVEVSIDFVNIGSVARRSAARHYSGLQVGKVGRTLYDRDSAACSGSAVRGDSSALYVVEP